MARSTGEGPHGDAASGRPQKARPCSPSLAEPHEGSYYSPGSLEHRGSTIYDDPPGLAACLALPRTPVVSMVGPMRSGRKKSVAAQRVEVEEVDTVSLRPAEQRRAFARGVHGMRWAGSLRDGRRRGEAGHLSAGRQPSRRCSNSQQPRRSDPSRCRRSHSCSRRPSRGHLSCLQTQPAKRRLSVWRIHPCHKPTTWREVKCCRWLMAAAVGKGSAPQVHGRAHPRGRRTDAISSTFISKVGTVKR